MGGLGVSGERDDVLGTNLDVKSREIVQNMFEHPKYVCRCLIVTVVNQCFISFNCIM